MHFSHHPHSVKHPKMLMQMKTCENGLKSGELRNGASFSNRSVSCIDRWKGSLKTSKIASRTVSFIRNLVLLDGNAVKMFTFPNEDADIWMVKRKTENVGVNISVRLPVLEMKMRCNVTFFKTHFSVGWSSLMRLRPNQVKFYKLKGKLVNRERCQKGNEDWFPFNQHVFIFHR